MLDHEFYVGLRIVHVLGVVLWIGGVAFVTTVLIPSLKRIAEPGQRLELFETLEGRFSFQAKVTTTLTGVTGLCMLHYLDAWNRYLDLQFWWLHLMTLVWLVFTAVLFLLEPLFLHQKFHQKATQDSDGAFRFLHTMHWVLLTLSLVAVFGAVAGSHGLRFF